MRFEHFTWYSLNFIRFFSICYQFEFECASARVLLVNDASSAIEPMLPTPLLNLYSSQLSLRVSGSSAGSLQRFFARPEYWSWHHANSSRQSQPAQPIHAISASAVQQIASMSAQFGIDAFNSRLVKLEPLLERSLVSIGVARARQSSGV